MECIISYEASDTLVAMKDTANDTGSVFSDRSNSSTYCNESIDDITVNAVTIIGMNHVTVDTETDILEENFALNSVNLCSLNGVCVEQDVENKNSDIVSIPYLRPIKYAAELVCDPVDCCNQLTCESEDHGSSSRSESVTVNNNSQCIDADDEFLALMKLGLDFNEEKLLEEQQELERLARLAAEMSDLCLSPKQVVLHCKEQDEFIGDVGVRNPSQNDANIVVDQQSVCIEDIPPLLCSNSSQSKWAGGELNSSILKMIVEKHRHEREKEEYLKKELKDYEDLPCVYFDHTDSGSSVEMTEEELAVAVKGSEVPQEMMQPIVAGLHLIQLNKLGCLASADATLSDCGAECKDSLSPVCKEMFKLTGEKLIFALNANPENFTQSELFLWVLHMLFVRPDSIEICRKVVDYVKGKMYRGESTWFLTVSDLVHVLANLGIDPTALCSPIKLNITMVQSDCIGVSNDVSITAMIKSMHILLEVLQDCFLLFPNNYSLEDLRAVLVILLRLSLDTHLVNTSIVKWISNSVSGAFEAARHLCRTNQVLWVSFLGEALQSIADISSCHHDLMYITDIVPDVLRQLVAVSTLHKLIHGSGLPLNHPILSEKSLQLTWILDLINDLNNTSVSDFYELMSVVKLLEMAVGTCRPSAEDMLCLSDIITKMSKFANMRLVMLDNDRIRLKNILHLLLMKWSDMHNNFMQNQLVVAVSVEC